MNGEVAKRKILVTGANGFLGGALVRHFLDHGYDVMPLVRDIVKVRNVHGLHTNRVDLPKCIDPVIPFRDAIVIHCAFTTRFTDEADSRNCNVDGTRIMVKTASDGGASKFVFVSSMSSHERALSVYGRHKYELEPFVRKLFSDNLVVRPGLIVGNGGLFARMRDMIRKVHLYPEFRFGDKLLQYIAIEDICTAIRQAIEQEMTGDLNLAHPEKVSPVGFYRRVARCMNTRALPVLLPGNLSLALLRGLERIDLPMPVSSDNLLGLKGMEYFEVEDDLHRVGLSPKRLEDIDFFAGPG